MHRLFRDCSDPDEKRKEILWTAISFIVIFASWLAVVLAFGYQPLTLGMTYDEVVLVTGLGLLVLCAILYLVGREREQRYTNRRLVSKLRATVENLDERLRQLDGLCTVSAHLAGSLDVDNISRRAVDALADSVQAARSYLVLVDARSGHPVYARQSHSYCEPHEATAPNPQEVWPGPLITGGDSVTDVEAQVQAWNERADLISAPFRLKNGLAGVLAAHREDGRSQFTPGDLNLLTTLANMTAKALESAQLHAELRESYLATVRSLVRSLDARDNYAATHSQRVATLAVRVAEQMGLPETAIRDIEVFAPLHDVGKIGVRDEILLKRGVLTEEERAICRQHCVIGDRIIRPLKPSREALALVRNHHESWDGRGYPDGLTGEQTPLLARIVKVADCFDAMISERPYGSVLNEQEALAHFRIHAGSYYDPAVVDALEAVLREEPAESLPLRSPGRRAMGEPAKTATSDRG